MNTNHWLRSMRVISKEGEELQAREAASLTGYSRGIRHLVGRTNVPQRGSWLLRLVFGASLPFVFSSFLATLVCGCSGSHSIVDHLSGAKAIAGCDQDVIRLVTGESIFADGACELVECSIGMREGIEFDPTSGAPYCIVVLSIYCAESPVRYHQERVPLLALLEVLRSNTNMYTGKFETCFVDGELLPGYFFKLVDHCGAKYDIVNGAAF